jgi:small multidrug resistance family-3 protein
MLKSLLYFLLAGACEIGGGYMVWQAVKGQASLRQGIFGAILLALYGLIATLQPAGFGRTYAAYGGVFVILSLLWGWIFDDSRPDTYDVIGAVIILIGTMVIFYAPRNIEINN